MVTKTKEHILSKLEPELSSRPEILFAYLFGSVAGGTANRLSDIDLAVYLDPGYRHQDRGYGYQSELITELSALLSTPVDAVILNTASTVLKYQVIKNGILIFSRSNEVRRGFHEKTVRDYLDLKPLLKVQQQCLRKRFSNLSAGGGQTA